MTDDALDRAAEAAWNTIQPAFASWEAVPKGTRHRYRVEAAAALRVMADDIRENYLWIIRDEFGRGVSAGRLERILDTYVGSGEADESCSAVLNIAGQHYDCQVLAPHDGSAHGNKDAHAIWADADPANSGTPAVSPDRVSTRSGADRPTAGVSDALDRACEAALKAVFPAGNWEHLDERSRKSCRIETAAALQVMADEIRAIHQRGTDECPAWEGDCVTCYEDWPCSTVRILDTYVGSSHE